MPLHVFFPCFGTKTVLFLERELCIKHGVTLVYTSSVRQALDDNEINAKSTEITDLTYQYDDKKYLQKKTFFVFFVCFFFRTSEKDLLIRMYFPTKTTLLTENQVVGVFSKYIFV